MVKALTFGVILFFYNLTPLYIPTTWWSFLLCYIVVDFCRYWAHRVSHEKRFLWATHVTHHSSEQYNFTVSFRLGWTSTSRWSSSSPPRYSASTPFVFFICMQIGVLYQFWIHTELIDRMWGAHRVCIRYPRATTPRPPRHGGDSTWIRTTARA